MKRYDDEVANRVFDAHCHEEWMQEKYVPTRIQQRLRERFDEIHSLHRRLSEFIATGQILTEVSPFPRFKARARAALPSSAVCKTISTRTACLGLRIASLHSFIDNLPYGCSRTAFRALLSAHDGVQAIYVGHPLICPPSGLYRAAWVCTATAESVEKIVEELSKGTEFLIDPITREKGRMKLNCSLQSSFKQAACIPAVLNTAESIQEDVELSLKALRALESFWVANSNRIRW